MAIAMLLSTAAWAASQTYPFQNPALPPDQRIDNLLSLMTADEKIDALGMVSGVPRLGVPNFGGTEGIHGLVQRGTPNRGIPATTTTQFPQPPGMGASWDPELVRRAGGVQGAEARFISQTGANKRPVLMVWGPQADLARDPRWGRSEEVYGEDPVLQRRHGHRLRPRIAGQRSEILAGRAASEALPRELERERTDVVGLGVRRAAVLGVLLGPVPHDVPGGGANAVMASYNAWNGTPMTIHPLLREVLIGKWGVQVISSDGGAVKNLWEDHKLLPDQKAAVVASLKAGINQYLDTYRDELRAAFKEGSVTEADLDEALRRKFRVTLKLGLLDPAGARALHHDP